MINKGIDVLISQNASIRCALERLCETAKGVLFVVESKKLIASLTDGDVRRFLLRGGSIDAPIFEAANKTPRFLFSSERERSQSFMRDNKISAVPIVDDAMHIEDVVFLFSDVDIDSVKIRRLETDDLPLILEFFDQMAGDTRAMFDRNGLNRIRVINHLEGETKNSEIHFVATKNIGSKERVVGYVFAWDIDKRLPWIGVAVREDWKGHRLGRKLLNYIAKWALSCGKGGLMLTSVSANIRAHALYERMGYEYFGTYPNGEFLYIKRFDS
jgi:GNAT superfamily N-acetyltransferase